MKELILGNAAVARGLYEAGCCVISSYPGTPSTEITEEAAKYPEIYCEWAPNEKVALETAYGASLAGKRAFCAMKHVGLNVAADPLFTISYTGVNAGLVIGVADDAGMHSSQNEQDSRHYALAAKLPMLEPSDSAEALAFAKAAFELSEEYDTPVLLKMCTRVSHSQSLADTAEREERLASVAQLEARKLELAAKQEMLQKAFDKALERLLTLPEEQYIVLLSELAVKAARTGREQVILSQKDRTRYGKQAVTAANEKLGDKGHLTLSQESRPIKGGLILSDGDVEVNGTFETLVRLQRGALDREVAKVLFDEKG